MLDDARAMDEAAVASEGRDVEEDREIASGSGEIVARAGGQIIPVIRVLPLVVYILFLSLSLTVCLFRSLTLPSSSPRSRIERRRQ